MPRTSRIFLPQSGNIFSVLSMFQCENQAKRKISLLLLNNFYPVTQEEKKATNYCIRFGHSLWSANQLPPQVVKNRRRSGRTLPKLIVGRLSSMATEERGASSIVAAAIEVGNLFVGSRVTCRDSRNQ